MATKPDVSMNQAPTTQEENETNETTYGKT